MNLKGVDLFSRLSCNNKMFDSDTVSRDKFEYTMEQFYRKTWKLILTQLETIESRLNSVPADINRHLRQSMYYKYLLLSKNIVETHNSGLLEEIDTNPNRYINADILNEAMAAIPPASPLRSLQNDLMLTPPDNLGYSNQVISYLEKAVIKNPDDDITGKVLFRLFTHAYDSRGNSEKAKKYYGLILDAFGDNYYARKAREYVQQNQ